MAAPTPQEARRRLRAWLEYVAQGAIDWLDELDAEAADLEDDELGDDDTQEEDAA